MYTVNTVIRFTSLSSHTEIDVDVNYHIVVSHGPPHLRERRRGYKSMRCYPIRILTGASFTFSEPLFPLQQEETDCLPTPSPQQGW